ncbi:MAG TPA: hypothetical protein VEL79_13700 [Vicinamibacterales bacterium]|nr:hypothetical protein [Vicinamibacterales bacterium]
MFTLEESAWLGFMLRFLGWVLLVTVVGACCCGGVLWMRAH